MNTPKLTLVILAAGMGSRYGGLKQMAAVGPDGEFIIDYAIYDAFRAGFSEITFVIRDAMLADFSDLMQKRHGHRGTLSFACQSLDDLPGKIPPPADRTKPWGTAHAVWATRNMVNTPFAVINADDFYGPDAYHKLASFLRSTASATSYCMCGYRLENTLSPHGHVSRGICTTNQDQTLNTITETTHIIKQNNQIIAEDHDQPLTGNEVVSMNCWGFTPSLFPFIEAELESFLKHLTPNANQECYLPAVVQKLITHNQTDVTVLQSDDHWFGVTYKEDRPYVIDQLNQLIRDNRYPPSLFNH